MCPRYVSSMVLTTACRTWAIASVMAPLVSGALAEEGQWRWLFCTLALPTRRRPRCSHHITDLNIPIAGAAAILVVLFMKMKKPEGTLKQKLAKMDWMWVIPLSTTLSETNLSLQREYVMYRKYDRNHAWADMGRRNIRLELCASNLPPCHWLLRVVRVPGV